MELPCVFLRWQLLLRLLLVLLMEFGNIGGGAFDCLGNSGVGCGGEPDVVAPVVMHGWSYVVAANGVRGPPRAILWTKVGKDFYSRRGKEGFVIIICSVDVGVR